MSAADVVIFDEAAAASSSAPADAPAPTTTAGKKIRQQRWVCDVCKVKWFLDFKEACAHEASCDGGTPPTSQGSSQSSSAASVAKEVAGEVSLISADSNDGIGAKKRSGKAGTSSSSTAAASAPQPSEEQVATVIAAARARRAAKNANAKDSTPVAVPMEGEELQASNPVDTDEEDGNSSLEEGMSLKRSERGRRSKRLRGAPSKPPPLKDSNTSSNASNTSDGTSEKKGKKSKAPKESTMGSKAGKSSSKSEDTSCAHSSKSGEKKKSAASKPSKPSSKSSKPSSKTTGAGKSSKSGGGQLASIFLSKKGAAASKKEPKKGKKTTDEVLPGVSREDYEEHLAAEKEAAQRKKKRGANAEDGKAKKGQQPLKRRKKPAKEEVVDIDSSSDEDSAESDGEYADKPKPKAKGKAKAAKNFLSKKQLAEHQAADFFAKRKQKAAEERERQRKREEARSARISGKSEGKEAGDSSTNAATAGGKATGIPAPRFPCPSHVAADDGGTDSPNAVSGASSALSVLREKPRYPHMKSDLSASADESENPPSLGFSTKAERTDQIGMSSAPDLLSSVFERRDGNQSDVEDSRLWTDKHSNLQDPDDILAEENIGAVHTLTSFVEEWKVRRHKAVQLMGQLKRKKKRRRKKSGYDSDDSFIDDGPGGLESLFLITGPTGSGKTRLVHAVAEQMECAVIEINSSGVRSGAALKRAIQETTQSHSSLAVSRKKQKNGANNFFGKTGKADESEEEEDSDGYSDESDEESVRESHSLTVILIDEADLLFDEDTAFWPALAQLSQKAKCPIVLTATSAPEEMNNFRYKGIALKRANPQECADRMAQVSHDEGMHVRDGIEPEEKTQRLSLIAEVCGCDMRKILNEMQLFHLGGAHRSSGGGVNMDGLWHQPNADSSSPSAFLDDEPLILSVEPRLVPRAAHTLITIKGKNFASTTFPSQSGEAERVELLMGGKPCSHYRIVSDSKIVAVCPPCAVPSGVSKESLIYEKSMQLDCMTCKFADVVVRKRCSNGIIVESKDTSSLRWNIEYDIPLRDSAWEEKRSRAEFIREAKARKEAREKEMAGDGDELMSSDEEEFEKEEPAPAPSPSQDCVEKEAAEKESGKQEPDEVKNIDPQTLLDDAIASLESPREAPSSKASLDPEDQSPPLVELKEFSAELDRLSDAVLLEDSLTTLAVPSLSGAVEGFGSNALESSSNADPSIDKLCKGKNKKPPSIDTIYSTGVNETGFFFGAGDSFMTHLPRRDRHLLSHCERSSRSLGHLDINRSSEDSAENSKSGLNDDDDENEDSPFFQPQVRVRSEDDILLNPHQSPALMSLPALLEQGLSSLRKNGFTKEQTPLLQSRGCQRAIKAFEFMQDAVGGFRNRWLRVWLNDSLVGGPLSLDYLPFLRAIAKHEDSARKRVEGMLKENGDAQMGGRRTRRSKKSNMRQHYLEAYAGPEWKERAIEARSTELAAHYLE